MFLNTRISHFQALKVDMVLETMWPDVANKCFAIFWERDEVKKAALKDGLSKVSKGLTIDGKVGQGSGRHSRAIRANFAMV